MLKEHDNVGSASICIVDDDDSLCQSLALTLNSVGYSVQSFSTADAFLAQPLSNEPVTVLIDFLLPGMTGLDLCREINNRKLPCTFFVITGYADVKSAVAAMKLGAIDVLQKPFGSQELLEVTNRALDVARNRGMNLATELRVVGLIQTLTKREREIFDAVADGLATKEIARRLGISVRTVDVHRSRIMQKLDIQSPLQFATILATLKGKTPE